MCIVYQLDLSLGLAPLHFGINFACIVAGWVLIQLAQSWHSQRTGLVAPGSMLFIFIFIIMFVHSIFAIHILYVHIHFYGIAFYSIPELYHHIAWPQKQ